MNPQTPERRSAADLQRILDSLIGDAGSVLSGNLPEALLRYETAHDLTILDPGEYDGLRALCSQHSDMELGPEEMFQFLKAIIKPSPPPSSPTPGTSHLPSSQSLPPSSFKDIDQTTPRQSIKQRRRRSSDRIRSPSDSSSSSSEDAGSTSINSIPIRRSMDRMTSAPPTSTSFPSSLNEAGSIPPRPPFPKRNKTLSDPRMDSPLASRMNNSRNGKPPSAYGNFGTFARPSPASRRSRRGSASNYGSDNEDNQSVESEIFKPIGRSTSSMSISSNRGYPSPTWARGFGDDTPHSPISPDGIDDTSFSRDKSPGDAEGEAIEIMVDSQSQEGDSQSQEEIDETEDTVGNEMMESALNPRLSRISTESSLSLRTSHDKLQALQKQNTELSRKLKESEKQLNLLGADNDRMVIDLERQLEETKHDLAVKRKEEKELKNNELNQKIQISGLEADLANAQRSLEVSKENRASMQKMYDAQCDEAQRLRDMLRDRDAEIHALEEAAQEHEADEDKFNAEVQSLEAEVKRLETELTSAHKAEALLETQKQENLQLKETIDRMRFDLDEARNAAAAALKGGHARLLTSGSSGAPTLSRNLGDEITRRLHDVNNTPHDEEVDEGEEGEDVVETVVTTRKTMKRHSRAASGVHGASGSANVPAIRVEDGGVVEYTDAGVLTEPVEPGPVASTSTSDHPPAYTAKADPINAKDVLEQAHPKHEATDEFIDPDYDAVVIASGVRCTEIEGILKKRQADQAKNGWINRASAWAERRKGYASAGIVNHFIYQTQDAMSTQAGLVSVCTVAAFAVGLIAGTHLFSHSGLHPRDVQLFSHMNDLARGMGAGEGFLPHGAKGVLGVVGTGAGMLAGRVPM